MPSKLFHGIAPVLTVMAILVHANLDWDWGPLRALLASPRFHRRHHTDEANARDKNFAGLRPIWDILFGTYYMPRNRLPDQIRYSEFRSGRHNWPDLVPLSVQLTRAGPQAGIGIDRLSMQRATPNPTFPNIFKYIDQIGDEQSAGILAVLSAAGTMGPGSGAAGY
jgi:fatty acid hydroxylase family protein